MRPKVEQASWVWTPKALMPSQLQELEALVSDFRDTCSTGRQDLGRTNVTYHQIDTRDAAPIKQAPRRLPIHRRQEVEHLINEMQEQGVIQPSLRCWASPIVLVQKKMAPFVSALTTRK